MRHLPDLFFLPSIMDIRADVLRSYLTLQDDPAYVARRGEALKEKVDRRISTFKALLDRDPIKDFEEGQTGASADLRKWILEWFGSERTDVPPNVEDILNTFEPIRNDIQGWVSEMTDPAQSIVVYRDRDGDRKLHA